jgi:transcriptional regulator
MPYNPPAFRETDLPKLHADIEAAGIATLITVGDDGPVVSHLPMLLDKTAAPYGTLAGHLARGNPQWSKSDLAKQAVVIFAGPDAYVSPVWYASKQEHGRVVPTWNYSLVYARGKLDIFHDEGMLREQVSRLSERFERRAGSDWEVSDAPADYIERQIKGIVGVRLHIETLEGKAKLSQNRSAADRDGVTRALAGSPNEGDRAVGSLMRQIRERKDARG